jgi:hypothetical protein
VCSGYDVDEAHSMASVSSESSVSTRGEADMLAAFDAKIKVVATTPELRNNRRRMGGHTPAELTKEELLVHECLPGFASSIQSQ